MKRGVILNQELSRAIASMGHGDLMLVCDAGFPIPSEAWRIDLALVQDVPDLEAVLTAVASEFIAEKVLWAAEMGENNPVLLEKVQRIFSGSEFGTVPHGDMLTVMAAKAKVIVRTGAFDPWGNIALSSGVNVPVWFSKPGTRVPEYYADRMK
jgi:D-ribose pyranase